MQVEAAILSAEQLGQCCRVEEEEAVGLRRNVYSILIYYAITLNAIPIIIDAKLTSK